MNKLSSMLSLLALVLVAGTGIGCYSDHDRHRRVYEPSGSDRYNRDGYYQGRRYDRGRYDDRYYDGRYDSNPHQWDNPNYRR